MAYTSSQVVQAVPTGINSALVLIAKTTLTAATQHNLLNVFSTTYDHYAVRFSSLVLGNSLNMRYGTSGTPDTASTYSNLGIYLDSGSIQSNTYRFNDSSNPLLMYNYAGGNNVWLEIQNPFLTQNTYYQTTSMGLSAGSQVIGNMYNGVKGTSTSYTDLVLLSSGNISGVISIYGYVNS